MQSILIHLYLKILNLSEKSVILCESKYGNLNFDIFVLNIKIKVNIKSLIYDSIAYSQILNCFVIVNIIK